MKDARKDFDVMIAYGDLHFPHNNAKLSNILLDVIEDIKPDMVLDGGDIISADCLGEYGKTHKQMSGLQSELNQQSAFIESIGIVVPKAKKIMLTDNHFTRRLSDLKKKVVSLEDLESLKPETLLNLDKFGWSYQKEYSFKDVLIFQHGDDEKGSQDAPINTARKAAVKSGVSFVRFHSHMTGFELHKNRSGYISCIQLGTFEDEDKSTYIKHPSKSNWSNSFGMFYLSKKTKEFFFTIPYFINGKCIVNGKVYG